MRCVAFGKALDGELPQHTHQGTKEAIKITTMTMAATYIVRFVAKRLREDEVGTWPSEFGGGLGMSNTLSVL